MAVQPLDAEYVNINTSSSGLLTLGAAVAGKRVRLLALHLSGAGTVGVSVASVTSGDVETEVMGALKLVANVFAILQANPFGWCQSAVGDRLSLKLSAGVAVTGVAVFVYV